MPNTLIEYLMEHPQRFSMVLCDEAHKMRNRETQTYKGAEVLMNLADTALFLTATPVMISQENLYNLCTCWTTRASSATTSSRTVWQKTVRSSKPFRK